MKNENVLDVIGIGIGPFNLSLAALLSPLKNFQACFFDQKEKFVWHPGLLLPEAEIQVNYLKDLVTLVDPTSSYSFIAYLAKQKRLYRFIQSNFKKVLRKEFNQYLSWVSTSLPNLFFQEKVNDIIFSSTHFSIQTSKQIINTKNIVLGSGLVPYYPSCVKNQLGEKIFHSEDFLFHAHKLEGKRIAIVGGGQSAAEIIEYLLSLPHLPKEVVWITKRDQYYPLDDSPFINEFFNPAYSDYFFHLPNDKKSLVLQKQFAASDGISLSLLERIYQKLYVLELVDGYDRFFQLLPSHQLVKLVKENYSYRLILKEEVYSQAKEINADIIILCTGYQWILPPYLSSLANRIPLANGHFSVNTDFSINWDGPQQNKIFVQNAAKHSHGIADPNLSLMAWRSARIINSLTNKMIYDLEEESTAIDWTSLSFPLLNTLRYAFHA